MRSVARTRRRKVGMMPSQETEWNDQSKSASWSEPVVSSQDSSVNEDIIKSTSVPAVNVHTDKVRSHIRTIIAFDNVTFGYSKRPFISNLSFNIDESSLAVISGPNGSGKTTLLYLIAGLQKPLDGAVSITDKDIKTIGRIELARLVALMPQYLPYTPWLTVREIVELGRYAHRSPSSGLRFANGLASLKESGEVEKIDIAMARAGILHLAERLSGELSGGELRRAHIARVLAQDSRIVLFDEPTSDLDLQHIGALVSLIVELNSEGKTVVVVTHDLNFASVLDGRLILMKDGSIIADGAPNQLINTGNLSKLYPSGYRVEVLSNGVCAVIPSRIEQTRDRDMESADSEEVNRNG